MLLHYATEVLKSSFMKFILSDHHTHPCRKFMQNRKVYKRKKLQFHPSEVTAVKFFHCPSCPPTDSTVQSSSRSPQGLDFHWGTHTRKAGTTRYVFCSLFPLHSTICNKDIFILINHPCYFLNCPNIPFYACFIFLLTRQGLLTSSFFFFFPLDR